MNSILFYITAACLAVGANAVCPILNEYVPGTRQVEVFNIHPIPTSAPCYLDVFATKFQNLFCVAIPDLLPGQYHVINLEIDFTIRTNEYLITVSSQPGLLRPTLDNFPLDLIFDTFYYRLPGSVAGYPFGGLVDEWSIQGFWASPPSISRCTDANPRFPIAWNEEYLVSLGSANLCAIELPAQNCPILNEFCVTRLRIEVWNNLAIISELCYIDVFDKTGVLLFRVTVPAMSPDTYMALPIEITPTQLNNAILIAISNNLPVTNDPTLFHDTLYYNPENQPALQPFVPAWIGEGRFDPLHTYICRCFSEEVNFPDAWFGGNRNSLGFPNDCSGSKGDPHFMQNIMDMDKKIRKICYDVTGKTGQSIFILNDKLAKVKVEGILMDDYYMHEVRVTMKGKQMTITRHSIFFIGKRYEWTGSSILYLEGATLTVSGDDVSIQVNHHENVVLTVKVKKSMNKWNVEHLDVFLGDLSKEMSRYGGIIGDVQKKEFIVSESSQSDNVFEVTLDRKTIRARLEKREEMECILLSFSSLIGSENVEKYIY